MVQQTTEKEIAMARQLALPLEPRAEYEIALMRAWSRSGMRVPYHAAVRIPALAICLRNMAAAEQRRSARRMRARLHPEINNWSQEPVDSVQFVLAN
jgi:hypothetical protein